MFNRGRGKVVDGDVILLFQDIILANLVLLAYGMMYIPIMAVTDMQRHVNLISVWLQVLFVHASCVLVSFLVPSFFLA